MKAITETRSVHYIRYLLFHKDNLNTMYLKQKQYQKQTKKKIKIKQNHKLVRQIKINESEINLDNNYTSENEIFETRRRTK